MPSDKPWIEHFAIEHGDLLLKYLKQAEKRTPKEVEMLQKIFSESNISQGADVLDLCCGYGRHAILLAERGYRMTAMDMSPILIENGKKTAEEMRIRDRIEFLVGDVRNVADLLRHKRGVYKAIICMWGSLGYYDDETDRSILEQSYDLASERSVLVLEMGNRDFYVKHLMPFDTNRMDDLELYASARLDLGNSRLKQIWEFYRKEAEILKHLASIELDMRVYSLHELIKLVGSARWKTLGSYGDVDMQPVTADTNRIIIVAEK